MKTFKVYYTKKIGGEGSIIVKAENDKQALINAKNLCYTGKDFRNAKVIDDSLYIKPSKQGFAGSHRQTN